ncbi:MAG: hypothetical protein A2064_10025 [Spirochaetes bacterium GWB1_66_5]|nr:MAG: hypothetical protein A2064_10025 [Spirochaetes bacterium GWB1_66_5]
MKATNLKSCTLAVAALVLIGACTLPTGSAGTDGAAYADNLASFQQEVEELPVLSADPGAEEIYAYAIEVGTLAGVYEILEEDVIAVVTERIAQEPLRTKVLGVLGGSISLTDLMVADTGMYQDEEEQVVVGLPMATEIPPDSPIQTFGTPEVVDDGERVGMLFDAAEDYLLVPADPSNDLTHQGTIEVWLKPNTNVAWAGIVHKGTQQDWSDEGYSFQYDGSGQLTLAMTSEAGQTILVHTLHVLATGAWSHVVVTWDEDEAHLYVNGVDAVDRINIGFTSTVTTIAENYPFRSSAGGVVIGTQIPGNPWRFDGLMADLKIYDRYMEQSEVLEG